MPVSTNNNIQNTYSDCNLTAVLPQNPNAQVNQKTKEVDVFRKKANIQDKNGKTHHKKSKSLFRNRSFKSVVRRLFSSPCQMPSESTKTAEKTASTVSSPPTLPRDIIPKFDSPTLPGDLIRKIAFGNFNLPDEVFVRQIGNGLTHIKFTGRLLSQILTTKDLDSSDMREIHIKIIDPKKCRLKVLTHQNRRTRSLKKRMEETAASVASVAINGGYYQYDQYSHLQPVGPLKTPHFDNFTGSSSEQSIPSYVRNNSKVIFRGQHSNLPTAYRNYYGVFAISKDGRLSITSQVAADNFEKSFYQNQRYALSCGPVLTKKGKLAFTEKDLEEDKFIYESLRKSQISEFHSLHTPPGTLYHADEPNPRSAIGLTSDGLLLMVTAKGRSSSHVGFSLPETAILLQHLGAVEALNLDGGASACQAYKAKNDRVHDSNSSNGCHNFILASSN
ncbi:MAG: exopolysaccharide biosynthesis protein [Chlamydiales bacterium]|jgi:exopolysaccharide biosynthesis protein